MKMPQDNTSAIPEKKTPAPQGDETNPKQPEAGSFSRYFEEPDVLKEHPGIKKSQEHENQRK